MYTQYNPALSSPMRSNGTNATPNVNIGLSMEELDQTADVFKVLLGMEYVLYVKLQNFHWNVTGMSFDGLHRLLGEQYERSAKLIDQIAEHIRKYGEAAPGSMQEFLRLNELGQGAEEMSGSLPGQVAIINNAMNSHEAIVRHLQQINSGELNVGAQELLGKLFNYHTKAAWMLRAHLI